MAKSEKNVTGISYVSSSCFQNIAGNHYKIIKVYNTVVDVNYGVLNRDNDGFENILIQVMSVMRCRVEVSLLPGMWKGTGLTRGFYEISGRSESRNPKTHMLCTNICVG